jgi:O-antigen ligase
MSEKSRFCFVAWVFASLILLFTVLLWQSSTGSGLNLFDALITLPVLFVILPLLRKHRLPNLEFFCSLAPLLLYIVFGLLSLTWADDPDSSKTFRGAVQVLALFLLFSYLKLSGDEALLRRALFAACCFTAIVVCWHLVVFYGVLGKPLSAVLYAGVSEDRLYKLGVTPLNPMLATLIIAPQAAMLIGLLIAENKRLYRFLGLAALLVVVTYLIALERRTAQVALLATVITCVVLYRNGFWYAILGGFMLVGGIVFAVFPEMLLSRGFSWRPEIWMSALDNISNAPIIGHGITNTVVPVVVSDSSGNVLGEFRHPHNMALSIAYNLGFIGLILWTLLWLPGLLIKVFFSADRKSDAYITLPMVAGSTALVFDSGAALSPLHYYWFCFWVPALLILSHPETGRFFARVLRADPQERCAPRYGEK